MRLPIMIASKYSKNALGDDPLSSAAKSCSTCGARSRPVCRKTSRKYGLFEGFTFRRKVACGTSAERKSGVTLLRPLSLIVIKLARSWR